MKKIVFIDDDENILKAISRLVRSRDDWKVFTYSNPNDLLAEGTAFIKQVQLFISDFRMPEMDGVHLLNELKTINGSALRILLSGQADFQAALEAINHAEVYRFMLKPWNNDELMFTLDNALMYQETMEDNIRLSNLVKEQKNKMKIHLNELSRLEKENPGITRLNLTEDGYIDLTDESSD